MNREWGGKFPPGQLTFSPLLPDFPVAMLHLDEKPSIVSPGFGRYTVEEWLRGIIEMLYFYNDGQWLIRGINSDLIGK